MMHLSALLSAVAFIPAVADQELKWIKGKSKSELDFGDNDAKIGENGRVNYGNFKFDNAGKAPLLILYRVTEGNRFDCGGTGDKGCWDSIPSDQRPAVGLELNTDDPELLLHELKERIDDLGDLYQYSGQHLVVWCKQFGVLFGYAQIPAKNTASPEQSPAKNGSMRGMNDVCKDQSSSQYCSEIEKKGYCNVKCPNQKTYGESYCKQSCDLCSGRQ